MEALYVIRKNGMYYAHNSCGYVSSVIMAEIYTEEHAKSHEIQCDECRAIPITKRTADPDVIQGYIDRLEVMRDAVKAAMNNDKGSV